MPYSEIFKGFSEKAETHPSKPAIFFKKNNQFDSLSYGQLYTQALKLGRFLSENGANSGDNIVILLGNQKEWPLSFMAIQSIGAIAVPIDINLTIPDIQRLIIHCGAKIVLCQKTLFNNIRENLKDREGLRIFSIDSEEFLSALEEKPAEPKDKDTLLPPDKEAAMFYTSGTTDSPKGVVLTSRNLLSNTRSLKELNIVGERDIFISFLPLHHTYSFMVTCLFPLLNASQISYPGSLTSEDLLNCLEATNVTVLTAVPQIFLLFHQKIKAKLNELPKTKKLISGFLIEAGWLARKYTGMNLNKRLLFRMHKPFGNNLHFMVTGGARLEPEVVKDFLKWGFTLLEGYGLTETSPVVTINPPRKLKIGSVGRPIPGVEVKTINPDENEIGEILIRGPNVMSGYYKMPRETQEAIRDGWFHSGDLGFADKDNYLYIQGRKDEMIVLSSGKKINPEEVEKSYASPYIKEICVFAPKVAGGMVESTRQLMAVIVPDEEYFRSQNMINIEERIKWEIDNLSQKLPSYKRIKGLALSKDSLPRTRLGKLMRHKIEQIYSKASPSPEEGKSQKPEEIPEEYRNLLEFLSNRLNKKVKLDNHLELDLGLDSLARIELFLELKALFNIDTPESATMDFFSVYSIKELFHKMGPYLPQAELKQLKIDRDFWRNLLKKEPDVNTVNMVRLRPSKSDRIMTLFFSLLFRLLFKVFFQLEVKGRKNLSAEGPFIIYANHTSYLDGFVIFSILPLRIAINSFFLGLSAYFLHPLLRKFNKPFRLVPIDASYDLIKNIRACAYILKNSKILCYFPEGQRAPSAEGAPFKKGIGILAKELGIPLIPVYIQGAFKAWPRFTRLPKPAKIKVIIGERFTCRDLSACKTTDEDNYDAFAQGLRNRVMGLKE